MSITKVCEGWLKRNHHGFAQYKETHKGARWAYQVTVFRGDDEVVMLMADGSERAYPIDSKNRISLPHGIVCPERWMH